MSSAPLYQVEISIFGTSGTLAKVLPNNCLHLPDFFAERSWSVAGVARLCAHQLYSCHLFW